MTRQIDFNFHGTTIRVLSQHWDLSVVENEFRHFIATTNRPDHTVEVVLATPPRELLPPVAAARVTANALEYRHGDVRWHDFHGDAISCYDDKLRQGCIWSADTARLHELTYLMVLSLTGKDLDRRGLHKVHACAFRHHGRDVVVMLPSHGGKTTLLLELARHPGVALLSDDTPLINDKGEVLPFPLRLGVHQVPAHLQGAFPVFQRRHHGDKFLIPLEALGAPLAQGAGGSPLLFFGRRWPRPGCHFERLSPVATLKGLGEHMVLGVGLPMVVEWFVRHTPADWWLLARIGISRALAAVRLWQRSEAWAFTMGDDPVANARALLNFLERR